VATTIPSQSDSYPKASRQSNADVPLVPRHARTLATRAHYYGRDQFGVTGDFSAPQTRL